MVHHIVVWRFKEEAQGAGRADNLRRAKELLDQLPREIPGIRSFTVGVNTADSPEAADLALVSEFDGWDALRIYQDHPAHRRVVDFLRAVRTERRVADWEAGDGLA
jgi:hypothetical protein